jgi:hypothetical protein
MYNNFVIDLINGNRSCPYEIASKRDGYDTSLSNGVPSCLTPVTVIHRRLRQSPRVTDLIQKTPNDDPDL